MHIVLVEPEIPQNTGNIARTCAATGSVLHLVHPLGFRIDESRVKRAGLDYWHLVDIRHHADWAAFARENPTAVCHFFSTKAPRAHSDAQYGPEDYLVFGKETAGLPEALLRDHAEACVRIPMVEDARSLNLANSVAVAVYEALRQQNYAGLLSQGRMPPKESL